MRISHVFQHQLVEGHSLAGQMHKYTNTRTRLQLHLERQQSE